MKTLLKSFVVAALAACLVHADDDKSTDSKDQKDLKKVIEDQGIYVETAQKGVVLSGYVDTSYTYQFASAAGSPSTPGTYNEGVLREFDGSGKQDSFNVNAFKLALEKALPDKNEWAAGFRADIIVGSDASTPGLGTTNTSSSPSTIDSSLWLEQAYAQFRVPVGNGLDFKFGKFVGLLGYEVVESPANLNYSRGLLFTNFQPTTLVGVMASYKFNDAWDAQFGVGNGWNEDQSSFDGHSGHGKAVTGRVNYTFSGKNANIANSFIYSPDGDGTTAGGGGNDLIVWDLWAQWAPKFANDKLLLAINTDLGNGSPYFASTTTNGATANDDTFMGVALYEKYQFTKVFSLALREEYIHDSDGERLNGGSSANSGSSADVYSFTATAGFNIWENLITRLEYRYDMAEASSINGMDQHEVSVNIVYTF